MIREQLRWYTKKAARGLVSFSGPIAKVARSFDGGARVRVLTYHRFLDRPQDPFSVPANAFRQQIEWLANENRLVSLADVVAFAEGKISLPDGAVLITMDDGQHSMLEAGRILHELRAPFVAFLTAGLIGSDVHSDGERFMTWPEVRELMALGATIGAHAFTHRSLGAMDAAEAHGELLRARAVLQEQLRVPVHAWAYPFGTDGDFSADTDRAAVEVGYRTLFHSKHGALRRGQWMRCFPRIKIESGESLAQFKRIVNGGLDAWRLVDDRLARFQRVRREL